MKARFVFYQGRMLFIYKLSEDDVLTHWRFFSELLFHTGRPSDMTFSHKGFLFTDSHFPTEAKKYPENSQSDLSLPDWLWAHHQCIHISVKLFNLLHVFEYVLFHEESVAVNTGYVIDVKENRRVKLALPLGKLCYKAKTGVLVCGLVRFSSPRGKELSSQRSFPYLSSSSAADKPIELYKAASSDNFPPGHTVHLQHAVLLLHIVLNAAVCRSRCLSSILNLPQL